ncbi:hypothetical protein NIES2107_74490 (plasmid) [Nostoc carneum NIES-2107]|nr:hypothetical protein NIES2107_74490 [Nostoc carneum NIES-2107]
MVNISARKTAKPSRKIERHIPALERVMTYQEKVHLMVVEVLREESGRELAAAARFNGIVFDWDKHNSQFRKDYVNTPLKELVNYYDLNEKMSQIVNHKTSQK